MEEILTPTSYTTSKKEYVNKLGFTLIELSIVMVIIGLIIGGVLVGNDLIDAAKIRSQVTQLEKYNVAVATFRVKYGYLPGDMPDPHATNFGFIARGQFAGQGDGNGVLEGITANAANQNLGWIQGCGETIVFWVDLSMAALISDNLRNASASETVPLPGGITATSTPNFSSFFPNAVMDPTINIIVYSDAGKNYYQIAKISTLSGSIWATESISVNAAYSVDKKIDDGKPQSGIIKPIFLSGPTGYWAGSGFTQTNIGYQPDIGYASYTTPTTYSPATCFDNGGVAGEQKYSLNKATSNNRNCTLTIEFK